MVIKNISEEKAIQLLREWNGQTPGAKMAEAERMFRVACDSYTLVDVETPQELNRMQTMEEFLTGGHAFYLYMRCPDEAAVELRAGRILMPKFFQRAETCYGSAYARGPLRLLIGIIQEKLDQSYDLGLFIGIVEKDRQERAQQEEPEYQPTARTSASAARSPAQSGGYSRNTSQSGAYARQEEQPRSNVVHYHFGQQVS